MKKRILSVLAAGALLLSSVTFIHAAAPTAEQKRIADALNHVELFLGTNYGYELEKTLTRAEGMVLLIRMTGKEEKALSIHYTCPFGDVLPWAQDYIGYAFHTGITKGVSDTEFEPDETMTDYMFLTLTLRALGYSDSGETPLFVWDDPYALAKNVGLIDKAAADDDFVRGDAVEILWNALTVNNNAMANDLIKAGAFTEDEFNESLEIYKTGKLPTAETDKAETAKPTKPETAKPTTPEADEPEFVGPGLEETEPDFEVGVPETNRPTVKPDGDKPAKPETDKPTTPETGKPTTPETDKPTTPETGKPTTPETDKPTTPETGKPTTPETDKPTTPETDKPTKPETAAPQAPADPQTLSYEAYLYMDSAEQQAFINSFNDPAAFFAWLADAKAKYDAENPGFEIGDGGSIDLDKDQ
ncbi:MAG: hypothetical protein E7638_07985 [Ruminococcaceae bacterium]|nr:hypothetical protein [Oscillospiraceae bacterium]